MSNTNWGGRGCGAVYCGGYHQHRGKTTTTTPTLAQTLSIGNRNIDHFIGRRRYVTMRFTFDIHIFILRVIYWLRDLLYSLITKRFHAIVPQRVKLHTCAHFGYKMLHCGIFAFLDVWDDCAHDGVIKWKKIPRYWLFVRGIHRSLVNSPHKGQWRRALVFSLICAWINGWVNNREAGDLRRHRAHYDVKVMKLGNPSSEKYSLDLAIHLHQYHVATLRPRQHGRHFADHTFKRIFLNKKLEFRLKYRWSLFPRAQLTISQYWFR